MARTSRRSFLTSTAAASTIAFGLSKESAQAAQSASPPQRLAGNNPKTVDLSPGATSTVTPQSTSALSISDCERPFPTDPAWRQSIVPSLKKASKLPKPNEPLPDDLLALHAPFSRSHKWSEPNDEEYRYLQAELLLNQASDLLDRGIRDRAEWNDMTVKQFNQWLEMTEFEGLDTIHENEITAGIYTSVAKASDAELSAIRASKTGFNNVLDKLREQESEHYSEAAINRMAGLAASQAYAAAAPYGENERSAAGTPAAYPVERQLSFNNSGTADKASVSRETSKVLTSNSMNAAKKGIKAQQEAALGSANSDTNREPGYLAKADWDRANCSFMYDRTKLARSLQIVKVKAATESGGVLNYGERKIPIAERAELDFQEAKAKLAAVSKGLRLLYGYDVELPQPDTLGTKFFDDCLLWVRRAMNWLIRFRQLEQSFVLPISLKNLSKDWAGFVRTGTFKFEIPESMFAYMRHVRLRGLSVVTVINPVKDDRASLFQATVRPPREAKCVHLSGTEVPLCQNFVPACRVARVMARGNIREPDVVGATALYNASPIGHPCPNEQPSHTDPKPELWTLSISKVSTTGIELKTVRDIQVDLHLAFRASKEP